MVPHVANRTLMSAVFFLLSSFCYVDLSEAMDAESVAKLDGQTFNGAALTVQIANARGDKGKNNDTKSPAGKRDDKGAFYEITISLCLLI